MFNLKAIIGFWTKKLAEAETITEKIRAMIFLTRIEEKLEEEGERLRKHFGITNLLDQASENWGEVTK